MKGIKRVQFISACNKLKVDQDKIEQVVNSTIQNELVVKIIKGLITKHTPKLEINDDIVKNIITYLINKNHKVDQVDLLKLIEKDDKNYKITKNISIEYTKILLNNQQNWLNFLDTHTKKDDLCDSLLQGYYKF